MAIILKRTQAESSPLQGAAVVRLALSPRLLYGGLCAVGLLTLGLGFGFGKLHSHTNPLTITLPATLAVADAGGSKTAQEIKQLYRDAASLYAARLAFTREMGHPPTSLNDLAPQFLALKGTEFPKSWAAQWSLASDHFIKKEVAADTCLALAPYRNFTHLDYKKNGVQCVTVEGRHTARFYWTPAPLDPGYWKVTLTGTLAGKLATWHLDADAALQSECQSTYTPGSPLDLTPDTPTRSATLCIPAYAVETNALKLGLSLLENTEALEVPVYSKEKPMKLTLAATTCGFGEKVIGLLGFVNRTAKEPVQLDCDLQGPSR